MSALVSRRQLLAVGGAGGVLLAGGLSPRESAGAEAAPPAGPFRYCLNTSTVRGQKLPLPQVIDIAARAGYSGIEPWINEIRGFLDGGGKLSDLKKRLDDHGLVVEDAIGFDPWIIDDEAKRKQALESLKANMDLVRQLGGRRIAAPPSGATERNDLPLDTIAERYRAILELGASMEVIPQLELWGFSQTLSKLPDLLYVAAAAKHEQTSLLCDVYHLYKGGSDYSGLRLIAGGAMQVLHMNDYPAEPPRATIKDAQRVYPGDGVAPLGQILRDLAAAGFRGALSLELFNGDYYKQDALHVALTGIQKMRDAVAAAFAK